MTYKTLPRPSSSNKQIKEYLSAAKKGRESIFVMPMDKGWGVRRSIDGKFSGTFSSKNEAYREAKKIASNKQSAIFFFNKEGELISKK